MNTLVKIVSNFGIGISVLIGCADKNMKRVDMYRERIGLPKDFDKEEFKDYYEKRFYRERRAVYAYICLSGKYNLKGTDGLYVDPEEAKSLLILYEWNQR